MSSFIGVAKSLTRSPALLGPATLHCFVKAAPGFCCFANGALDNCETLISPVSFLGFVVFFFIARVRIALSVHVCPARAAMMRVFGDDTQ